LEKRQRITGHTLVVGMDIGSEFNAACFMDGVIPFLVEIEVWLPPWDNPRDDIS
jgi:hypothetical protein